MAGRADSYKSSTGAWLVLACIGVVSLVVVGSVLKVRVETGESYPHYSSLRADPLGTRGLYESLEHTRGLTLERNFMPLDRLPSGPQHALIMSGMTARAFNSPYWIDARAVSHFVIDGGRLVIALSPEAFEGRMDRAIHRATQEVEEEDKKAEERKKKETKAREDTKAGKEGKDQKLVPESKPAKEEKESSKPKRPEKKKQSRKELSAFAEVLHIAPKAVEWFYSKDGEGSKIDVRDGFGLKAADCPKWMSNVFLDDTPDQNWKAEPNELSRYAEKKSKAASKTEDKATKNPEPVQPSPWKIVATKGDRTMIAQRQLGAGTVIVCSDRYFLSNEALWKHPSPAFLSWLIGDATHVIFEETHLGSMIGDEEGIMTLARRHGMHGLFLGGLLLFALFIWRSTMSLVPSNPDDDMGYWRADAVAGHSSASGLEGLLRRGFGTKGLLKRCFDVWSTTRAASTAIPGDRLAKARQIVDDAAATKHSPTAYRAVRDALHPPR